ncbi:MAG: 50S ribosomal protein L11 methyltransferase [Candidatus Electrothrix sp. Rat3]|nr:50S ribosomal protein L11 methyltransferase [Candidatus Electrothrix rattekaaiensis]
MLRSPYTEYQRLHVYYLDHRNLPPITDPDLIGIWIEDETAILFFHQAKEEFIQALCQETGASIVYQADLDYQDWEAGVKITSFATKTLQVRPVWEMPDRQPDQQHKEHKEGTEILLDPSVIFGSGFHATTRLCLETLELLLLESGLQINSVLDLGTGTGLLAVAAAKLGVDRVTALDNNPLAVEVAQANVERNNCADIVTVQQFDLTQGLPDMQYDLVITNLYKGLLIRLFDDQGFWHPGIYMVSGFIPGMEPDLLAALPADRIQMLHRGNAEQWRLWLLQYSAENQGEQQITEKGLGGNAE